MTADELATRLRELVTFEAEDGGDGYEKSADAMWRAALVAFNWAASEVGATGFQASWAALKFYGEALSIRCPFMVVQVGDALYPQYDVIGKVESYLSEQRPWLAEQAAEKLAEFEAEPTYEFTDDEGVVHRGDRVHPDVVAHWRRLVAVSA